MAQELKSIRCEGLLIFYAQNYLHLICIDNIDFIIYFANHLDKCDRILYIGSMKNANTITLTKTRTQEDIHISIYNNNKKYMGYSYNISDSKNNRLYTIDKSNVLSILLTKLYNRGFNNV